MFVTRRIGPMLCHPKRNNLRKQRTSTSEETILGRSGSRPLVTEGR
jgi:hypothetical protein